MSTFAELHPENHNKIPQGVTEKGTWEGILDFSAISNDHIIRFPSGNPTHESGPLLAIQATPGKLRDKSLFLQVRPTHWALR